jgi:hypothetical protein
MTMGSIARRATLSMGLRGAIALSAWCVTSALHR